MVQGNAKAVAIASATIFVSGKVQGVYFRKFTQEKALSLELTGFVQNLPDFRVMLVAQGDVAGIKALIDYLRIGPKRSNVESVDVEWSDPSELFTGFTIRR